MKKLNKIFEVMNSVESLDYDFADIIELTKQCKYSNCTHTSETKCAVKEAISDGILSAERFDSYFRLKGEAEYVSKEKNKTKAIDYMKQKKLFQ